MSLCCRSTQLRRLDSYDKPHGIRNLGTRTDDIGLERMKTSFPDVHVAHLYTDPPRPTYVFDIAAMTLVLIDHASCLHELLPIMIYRTIGMERTWGRGI